MRQTARILSKLLLNGELSDSDKDLLAEYRTPEVRAELDIWGEELGFSLVDMRGKVYLIPQNDSELLSMTIRDVRESRPKHDHMIDAFLQCYITMTILWMLYGGKNNNPKRATFLQIKDIVTALDERLSDSVVPEAGIFETEYEINFSQISSHWNALPVFDETKAITQKSRIGRIWKACSLMRDQQLLIILDENREIRPTDRLDDLMIGYYLDMRRLEEIHKLFDSMEETSDAKTQQD